MNLVLHLVRTTLSRAFDLYAPPHGVLREAALYFFLVSLLGAAVFSSLVGYLIWELDLYPSYLQHEPIRYIYLFMCSCGFDLCSAFVLLSLGLFAIAQRQHETSGASLENTKMLFYHIRPGNWNNFIISLMVLFSFAAMYYPAALDAEYREHELVGSWDGTHQLDRTLAEQLGNWGLGAAKLVLQYVPVILSLFLLISHIDGRLAMSAVRNRLPGIGAALLLMFVIEAILNGLREHLQELILPPFIIIFSGSLFPVIAALMLSALLSAFCIPFICACIYMPVDRSTVEDIQDGLHKGHLW